MSGADPLREALALQHEAAALGFDWGPRHGAAQRGCGSAADDPGKQPCGAGLARPPAPTGLRSDTVSGSYLDELWDKLAEEIAELKQAATQSRDAAEDELGDLLFMAVNLARHLGVDPVSALARANAKFTRRFAYIAARLERLPPMGDARRLEAMEALWQEAKRLEKNG